MLAAASGHLEVARVLLDAGADHNAASQDGLTALIAAARHGHLEVVQLLLEAGSDKKVATQGGETALMAATENGHLEVVRVLCSRLELTRMRWGALPAQPLWWLLTCMVSWKIMEVVQLLRLLNKRLCCCCCRRNATITFAF